MFTVETARNLIDKGTIYFTGDPVCHGLEINVKGSEHSIFVPPCQLRDIGDATIENAAKLVHQKLETHVYMGLGINAIINEDAKAIIDTLES